MSSFGGIIFTDRGRNLQAKAQAGATLVFTRIAVGDGELGSSAIKDLTALKNQILSLNITKLKTLSGGKAVVGTVMSNQGLAAGFYWREVGVFAQDPDLGEILYCYGNSGSVAEYIPAGGGPDIVEKSIDIITIVGNAASVTATIEQSLVYATAQELVDHENDTAAHGLAGKISHSLATAINDFLVASGPGQFVKKTLAEVKAILGLGTAAYTDTSAYAPAGHIADTSAHGATSAATANAIMMRDASGRAKVAAPSASDDIARKDTVDAVQTNLNTHAATTASTSVTGHIKIGTGATDAAAGNHNHSGVYEPVDANIMRRNTVQTMSAILTAQSNTSYTTAQVRNIVLSTADPSGGNNGDIWIKYTA
ncbi:MAG: phage tail protein [Clostridiales bacterium]|jgi:hypothetical protein|nr:phage tail protein [Eubacteriales bacterium]MDH7566848.1 phage tail protein [Clostridiales bacterium]